MKVRRYQCSECVWIGNEGEADDDSQYWLVCPDCGANIIETHTKRKRSMSTTAWLIETVEPMGTTLYFCNDGDWCSNPNHAHKFPTADQASVKLSAMQVSQNFRVAEHMWCD